MESGRTEILLAAMKGVRLHGLDGVKLRQIGALAGTAASNIYFYFSGKEALLRECFYYVDREIAHLFDRAQPDPERMAADPMGAIRDLWTPYFRWLVNHPDQTVFYHRFRDSPAFPAFDRQRDVSYFTSFIGIVGMFQSQYRTLSQIDQNLLWLHVLTTTVMYAKYVVEGVLPSDAATEESIFQMLMYGLRGLMQPEAG